MTARVGLTLVQGCRRTGGGQRRYIVPDNVKCSMPNRYRCLILRPKAQFGIPVDFMLNDTNLNIWQQYT